MELNIVTKLTACFMLQSCLFMEVCMSPVQFNDLSALKQTFDGREAQSDILNEIKLQNPFNRTAAAKDETEDKDILSRFTRSLNNPCELIRERTWNSCLGKYYTKIHCRKSHIACLPYKAPPRCRKVRHIIFAVNGQACHVVKKCVCA